MKTSHQLQPEDELILLSADIRPDETVQETMTALIPRIRDWEAFTQNAIDRAAAPLLVDKLSKRKATSLIPEEAFRRLKQASLKTLTRNMLLAEHFRQVVGAFSQAGIPVLALKGSFLSEWLYGNINLRQFSDLDLLVPQEKGLEAVGILRTMGYHSSGLVLSKHMDEPAGFVHYPPMVKQGVSVEVHIRIHPETEAYQVDLDAMWKRAVPYTIHGVEVLAFCPEDLLLHLCLHLDKHFQLGKFQFTCFYDLVNLLNHKADQINWETFEKRCIQANADSATFPHLILAHDYMHARLPASIVETHSYLVSNRDKRIFLRVLKGKGVTTYTGSVAKSIIRRKGIGNKFRYFGSLFFPSREFMMQRYRLTHTYQLALYYPYRLFVAFKRLWQSIINY